MTHAEAQKRLPDYVDGLLPPEVREEVRVHLVDCTDCLRDVEQLQSLKEQARALPDGIAPARDLWPGIASRIGSDARQARHQRWFAPLFAWRGLVPTTLATAAGLAIVFFAFLRSPNLGELALPTGREVAQPDLVVTAMVQAMDTECEAPADEIVHYGTATDSEQSSPVLRQLAKDIRTIDQAITEVRNAWTADPNSPHLARLLASYYRAKAALQGKATELADEA